MTALSLILFFGTPIAAIVCAVFFHGKHRLAQEANNENPGTYSDEQIKKFKAAMTASAVIAGFLSVVVIGIVVLLFTSVAYM